jgi:hypothetical protein
MLMPCIIGYEPLQAFVRQAIALQAGAHSTINLSAGAGDR